LSSAFHVEYATSATLAAAKYSRAALVDEIDVGEIELGGGVEVVLALSVVEVVPAVVDVVVTGGFVLPQAPTMMASPTRTT